MYVQGKQNVGNFKGIKMVWDRSKQNYWISRNNRCIYSNAENRCVGHFTAYFFDDELVEKICFAANDEEVKRLLEDWQKENQDSIDYGCPIQKVKEHKKAVKAGIAVIICNDDKVLIGKRKNSHGAGLYCFPGGHIEYDDETLVWAAVRETKEETGVNIKVYETPVYTSFKRLGDGVAYVTVYMSAIYINSGFKSLAHPGKIIGLEQEKCEYWEWVDYRRLREIAASSDEQQAWLPTDKINFKELL